VGASRQGAEQAKILTDLPELETERLLLRRMRLDDTDAMFAYAQTLTGFLDNLLSALKNPAAMEALEDMEQAQSRKRYWGWLNRYVKLEPGIYGFGVNLNKVLSDIAAY
ncbi:MAG: hypothetical protein M3317_00035, partial [Actinomycetota bacterium]|nr:hypothetical protein [Actinomycetota bacterium]